jgi:hypothetical protein
MEGGGALNEATALARVNLRDLARKVEEAAVILEGEGFRELPGELMKVSERLTECREALDKVIGHAK